jgi:uncharacterized membrane protein YgcG
MKAFFKGFLFSLFLLPFFVGAIFANEQISLFRSDITLEESTDINIREEIHYVFPTSRRGIVREIPVDYKVQAGLRRPTRLVLNEIYYYSKENPDRKFTNYERESKSGYVIFRIGNPDVTITGEYVYVIDYVLKDAVNYFDDHDELFLNITGSGWNVPIQEAYANIEVPGEITERVCFTGPEGSTVSECSFEEIGEKETKLSIDSPLGSFEGYTVVIKMPKGTLDDTRGRQRIAFLLSNIGLLLPIPVFIYLLSIIKKKGSNKKKTIIAHFEPEKGMYPLLAGYVYNKKLDNKHITAEIIQMAIDGHIKIKQEGKRKYILEKEGSEDSVKNETSRSIFSGLFKKEESIDTKKIPSDFYKTVRDVDRKLNSEAYSNELFSKDRKKLKGRLSSFGFIGLFLSFFSLGPLGELAATGWSFGFGISSILSMIFSSKVDIRGEKGNDIYHELEGLKRYINTAEKHRIEFHNDPEKFRGVFEQLLPYAIIFGLEKKWANEFKDIYKEPPSWYEGDMTAFNSYVLASSIAGISRNVQSKSVAPNSAGGHRSSHGGFGGSGFSGGSSGGGFGGGGGSSW